MNSKKEVQQALEQETAKVNDLANKMYKTWVRIDEIRKTKRYQSSNVNLKVYKGEEVFANGIQEYHFDQVINNVHESKGMDDQKLPSEETSRRNRIKNLVVKVGLKINGKRVAETNKY